MTLPCRDCGKPGIGMVEWCGPCYRKAHYEANRVIRRLERHRVGMVKM